MNSALLILLSRIAVVVMSLGTLPLIARALGPEGRGEAAAVVTFVQLLAVLLTLGLQTHIRREVALAGGQAGQALRAARYTALIMGALAGLAAGLAGPVIISDIDPELATWLIPVAAICTLCGICWLSDASVLIGQGRSTAYAVVLAVPSIVQAVGVVLLYVTSQLTVLHFLQLQAPSYLLAALIASRAIRLPWWGQGGSSWLHVRTSMAYFGAQVAESLAFRADQVIAVAVMGAHAAGIYSIAATVGMLPMAVGQALATAYFQDVVRDEREEQVVAETTLGQMTWLGVIAACGLALCVPFAVPVLFGEAFRAAVGPTFVSLIGGAVLVVMQGVGNLLIRRNLGWRLSASQMAGLAVGLGLLVVLGGPFGAMGGSAASTVGFMVAMLWGLRSLGLSPVVALPRASHLFPALRSILTARPAGPAQSSGPDDTP